MITAARTGIDTALLTVAGLTVDNTFFTRAPQNSPSEICVWSLVTNTNTRDTSKIYEQMFVQFNLYGKNLATLEGWEAGIKTVFDDDANITIAGYAVESSLRNFSLTLPGGGENDDWQVSIQYQIDIEPN